MSTEMEVEAQPPSSPGEDQIKPESVPSSSVDISSTMSEEELLNAVRKQVEYYFSKENLQQDAYLTSHMDSNMSVPLSVIMKFSKMKALTQDEAVIFKALENSSVSIIEGNRIKANVKTNGRSTIILREIPSDAPEDEVREIFNYEGCKPVVSMRSDIGDTWFINFENEDDAKNTLMDLRLKKRLFRGAMVKGRVKSESILRSFYQVPQNPQMIYPNMGFPIINAPLIPPPMYGYAPLIPGQILPAGAPLPLPLTPNSMIPIDGQNSDASMADSSGNMSGDGNVTGTGGDNIQSDNTQDYVNGSVQGRARSGSKLSNSSPNGVVKTIGGGGGGSKDYTSNNGVINKNLRDKKISPSSHIGHMTNGTSNMRGGSGNGSGGGRPRNTPPMNSNGGRRGDSSTTTTTTTGSHNNSMHKSPPIEISSDNFPPLNSNTTVEDTPIPSVGYKGTYIKYTVDDIMDIVKTIATAELSDDIKPEEHPLAMTVSANMDLLRRQRSISIEETREFLRQGRPVHKEAIASGTVDYGNMMYGDGYDFSHMTNSGSAGGNNEIPTFSDSNFGNDVVPVYGAHQTTNVPFAKNASTWAALVKSSTPADSASTHTTKHATTASSSSASKGMKSNHNNKPTSSTNNNHKKGHVDQKSDHKKGHNSNHSNTVVSTEKNIPAPKTENSTPSKQLNNNNTTTVIVDSSQVEHDLNTTDLNQIQLHELSPETSHESSINTEGSQPDHMSNHDSLDTPIIHAHSLIEGVGGSNNNATFVATTGSGWAGKPTFANILKVQAAAGEQGAVTTAPTTPPATSKNSGNKPSGDKAHHNRSRSNSKSYRDKKDKSHSNHKEDKDGTNNTSSSGNSNGNNNRKKNHHTQRSSGSKEGGNNNNSSSGNNNSGGNKHHSFDGPANWRHTSTATTTTTTSTTAATTTTTTAATTTTNTTAATTTSNTNTNTAAAAVMSKPVSVVESSEI